MSTVNGLFEQAKAALFTALEPRRAELVDMDAENAVCEIAEALGAACDAVLDEKTLGFTAYHTLLLHCCTEDMHLFTDQPDDIDCIRSANQTTAAHCVYHNLYNALHTSLEQEFEDWHAAEQSEESARE